MQSDFEHARDEYSISCDPAKLDIAMVHGFLSNSYWSLEASGFFANGSLGYSVTGTPGRYDGLELCCSHWRVEPLQIDRIASTFFDDTTKFPTGTIGFDCALLMRNIQHEWHGRQDICCTETTKE
jgi:hypothetical protein